MSEAHGHTPIVHTYIEKICGWKDPAKVKVLDFGCGGGEMVKQFLDLGYAAYGCDLKQKWRKNPSVPNEIFKTIPMDPYRLPYEDNTFDVVFSISVLEHAKNKRQCFEEIRRILKGGGVSIHLFPAKYYLPSEPHIFVPLANCFWPRCPKWWLQLWALLGVRNGFQTGLPWRQVADLNHRYCQDGLSYWKNGDYRELSLKVFGNFDAPMQFYLSNSGGGAARLFRELPLKPVLSWLLGSIRNRIIVSQKAPASETTRRSEQNRPQSIPTHSV